MKTELLIQAVHNLDPAKHWKYKAEGAANVTFSFIASPREFEQQPCFTGDGNEKRKGGRSPDTEEADTESVCLTTTPSSSSANIHTTSTGALIHTLDANILKGMVLRVSKQPKSTKRVPTEMEHIFCSAIGSGEADASSSTSMKHDDDTHKTRSIFFPTMAKDALEFATLIMRPLLGEEYVIPGIRIPTTGGGQSYSLLQTLNKLLITNPTRPKKRHMDVILLETLAAEEEKGNKNVAASSPLPSIVLMLDHTKLYLPPQPPPPPTSSSACSSSNTDHGNNTIEGNADDVEDDICFEIKPKSGLMPSLLSSSLLPCRYCQHQIMKAVEETAKKRPTCCCGLALQHLEKGSSPPPPTFSPSALITSTSPSSFLCADCREYVHSLISLYCPLDLYSGSQSHVSYALSQLLVNPQNNFRVFVNGEPVYNAEILASSSIATSSSLCSLSAIAPADSASLCNPSKAAAIASAILQQKVEDASLLQPIHTTSLSHTHSSPNTQEESMRITTKLLLQTLAQILVIDPVLSRIRKVQEMSPGLEKAGIAYKKWRMSDIAIPSSSSSSSASSSSTSLCAAAAADDDSAPEETVRNFLLSQTAKDVSLLIACRFLRSVEAVENAKQQVIARKKSSDEDVRKTNNNLNEKAHVSRGNNNSTISPSASDGIQHAQRNLGLLYPLAIFGENNNDTTNTMMTTMIPAAIPLTKKVDENDFVTRQPHAGILPPLGVLYSVAIVDVDAKAPTKIPMYLRQEEEISYLYKVFGAEIFTGVGKVCAAMPGV